MEPSKELKVPEGYEGHKVKCQEFLLFDSHVELKLPNGMTKAISLGDFVTTLAKTMNHETSMKATLLPANCYIWGQTLTEMKLACYYPGKPRKVEWVNKHQSADQPKAPLTFEIPFPNIVISHVLKKRADAWEHSESRYFATSKPVSQLGNEIIWAADHKNQIWAPPLGNMYPDGRLCYGQNSLPRGPYRESFRGLDWHFAVLYISSFNNDLAVPSLAKAAHCSVWYESLAGQKVFPYEALIGGKKIGTGISTAQDIAAGGIEAATGDILNAVGIPLETQAQLVGVEQMAVNIAQTARLDPVNLAAALQRTLVR